MSIKITTHWLWLVVAVCLSACVSNVSVDDKTCQLRCQKHYFACEKVCRNNHMNCNKLAHKRALTHYLAYQKEQCLKGAVVARELNSYRDPLQCRKTTCHCLADYSVCAQSCSGVIQKQWRVPSAC